MFHHDGSEEHRAEHGDRVLRAVRDHQGDSVAGADPRLMERPGAPAHVRDQLRVGKRAGEEVDRGAARVAGGNLYDHVRYGAVRGRDLVGNTGRVQGAQRRRKLHLFSFGSNHPTIP